MANWDGCYILPTAQKNDLRASIFNSINNRQFTDLYWCCESPIILAYYCSSAAHHLSAVKIKIYFFVLCKTDKYLYFFRIFHFCKLNPRTSTRFLERFMTHIVSFNSSPVIESYFSELRNIYRVYITVHSNPSLLNSQGSLILLTL